MLSRPALKYPSLFPNTPPTSLFTEYPYALPCVICCILNTITCLLAICFLKETRFTTNQEYDNTNDSIKSKQSEESLVKMIEMTEINNNTIDNDYYEEEKYYYNINELCFCFRTNKNYEYSNNNMKYEYNKLHNNIDNHTESESNSTGESNLVPADSNYDIIDSNTKFNYNLLTNDDIIPDKQISIKESDNSIPESNHMEYKHHEDVPVLLQFTVVMACLNYGSICMGWIIVDETLPLLLKSSSEYGGFGLDTLHIGIIISCSGFAMVFFTLLLLPYFASQSKKWLLNIGVTLLIPIIFCYPALGVIHKHYHFNNKLVLPLLIAFNILRYVVGTFCFTATNLQVNNSVVNEYLGSANGLGQSFAAFARTIGPLTGGLLWSVSTKHKFIFLNYIVTSFIFSSSLYINFILPMSLDYSRKRNRYSCIGITPITNNNKEIIA